MSHLFESVADGILVVRHRDFSGQGYDLDTRLGLYACELDRHNVSGGGMGEKIVVRKSIGDLNGAFFWPAASRPIGGWSWLWGAMAMASSRAPATGGAPGLFAEVSRLLGEFGLGGGTPSGSAGEDNLKFSSMKTAFILPVESGMNADSRFGALVPARPRKGDVDLWPKFPRGWYGIALAATDEDRQGNLWFPTDPRLVAVNAAGDHECGTLVVDTTKKYAPDIERMAPLQSAFRVVKVKKLDTSAIGGGAGPSGDGAYFGGTPHLNGLARILGVNPAPTIRSPQDPFFVKFIEVKVPGAAGAACGDEPEKKPCIDWLLKNMIAWNIGVSGARDARGGGVVDLREGSGDKDARTVGMVSKFQSGPFDVGGDKDKHEIDQDEDGNPINAAHISTNALFRKSDKLDAPLRFEGEGKKLPRCGPFAMKVHLQYFENIHDADKCPSGETKVADAPAVFHPFTCGARRGIWAWWSESKVGDEESPESPPTPKTPSGYGSTAVVTPGRPTVRSK